MLEIRKIKIVEKSTEKSKESLFRLSLQTLMEDLCEQSSCASVQKEVKVQRHSSSYQQADAGVDVCLYLTHTQAEISTMF